jgi:hypothetical protein
MRGSVQRLTVGALDEAHVQLASDHVQHFARAGMVVDGAASGTGTRV